VFGWARLVGGQVGAQLTLREQLTVRRLPHAAYEEADLDSALVGKRARTGMAPMVRAGLGTGDDENGATPPSSLESESSTDLVGGSEEILIKTHADLEGFVDVGEVLRGSSLGGSAFCPGGTWRGGHENNLENGWLDKRFECPDGTLTLGFDPSTLKGRTPSGPWEVVSGTGAFEGLEGSGQMEMRFAPGPRPIEGRETFTGTLRG
jgi:hypothetical protein